MKALSLLICLLAFSFSNEVLAQNPYVVGDTCDSYYTTYYQINDSVHKVTLIREDIKLFEGFVIHPKTYFHLGNHISEGKVNIYATGWKLDSTSIYRNPMGKLLEWTLYKNGVVKEKKLFNKDTMTFHSYSRKGVVYNLRFENGKVVSTEKFYPEKHLLIIKDETGTYKFGTGNNPYERLYIYGNKTETKYKTNKGDKVITYYFDKTFIIKRQVAYSNGKLSSIEEFDKKGRNVKFIQYENGKTRDIQTHLYIDDSSGNSVITTYKSKKNPQKNSTSEYTINKKNSSIQYRKDANLYFVRYTNDTCTLLYSNSSKERNTKISINIFTPTSNTRDWEYESGDIPDNRSRAYSIQKTGEYEIRTMVNNYHMNPYFNSIFTGYSNTYLVYSLTNEFLYEREDLANLYNRINSYNSIGRRTDSIFIKGQLQYIFYRNNDTSALFEINSGKKELLFHSHFLQIAKDQVNCNLGFKTTDGQWLNGNRYDNIDQFHLSYKEKYYVGYSAGYVTIYNWKGDIVLGPVYGLRYHDFDDENPFYHTYLLSTAYKYDSSDRYLPLFLIENNRDSIYGFMDINGQMQIKSRYKIILRHDEFIDEGWNIEQNNKTGFANLKGIIIPPRYESIYKYKSGHFIVSDSLGSFITDSAGNALFNERYTIREYNSDSGTVVFISQNGKQLMAYNLNTNQKVFEKSQIELKYFNSNFYKLVDNATHKIGIAGKGFIFQTKVMYDEVLPLTNRIVCKKGNLYEFYTTDFKFLNKVFADTILFMPPITMNFNYYGSSSFYYDKGNYYPNHRYLFSLNNQMGLLNMDGEVIIPAKYNTIAFDDQSYCYGLRDTIIDCYGLEHTILSKKDIYPRETFSFLYEWRQHNKIKFLDWKGNEIKIPYEDIKSLNNNTYSYSNNGTIKGFINRRGEFKFNIDSVSKIDYSDNFCYFTNYRQKAGIMNCRFQPLYTSESEIISDVYLNRFVWISHSNDIQYPRYNLPVGSWRLVDTKTGAMLDDTFHTPTPVQSTYTIVKNKNGLIGILDSNLNFYRKCMYTKYKDFYSNNYYVFQRADSLTDVFTTDFKFIKTLNFDKIHELDRDYLAFKAGKTYLLNSELKVIDSSTTMFSDRNSDFLNIDSTELFDIAYTYFSHYNNTGADEEQITKWKRSIPIAYFNFYKIILLVQNESYTNTLNTGRIHFLPNIEHNYYNNPYPYDISNFNFPSIVWNLSGSKHYLNYRDFELQEMNYELEGYKGQWCTFSKSRSSYDTDREYVNYCFSDSGIYEINLVDIIEPGKAVAFEKLLLKKIIAIDDPEAPCLKKDDLLNTYSNSFIFGMDGILILIDDEYSFHISYKELEEFLKK